MKRTVLIVVAMWMVGLCISAAGLAYSEVLDSTEEEAMTETLQHALEYNSNGRESYWSNPDSGHAGSVMPFNRFVDSGGLTCREYVATLYFDGEEEREYGTACRNADGLWMIVLGRDDADYAGEPLVQHYDYVYRDPARYYYPWVYYAPAYYPYRIFFSFVFASHSGHFHRHYFYPGYHYHPRKRVVYHKKPHYFGDYHRKLPHHRPPPVRHRLKRHDPPPTDAHSRVHKPRHKHRPPPTDRHVRKRDTREPHPDRTAPRRERQHEARGEKGMGSHDGQEARRYRTRDHQQGRKDREGRIARREGREHRRSHTPPPMAERRPKAHPEEASPRSGRPERRMGHGRRDGGRWEYPLNRGFLR